MIGQHKVTSKADAEDYIARLEGVSTYLGQHLANAKASAERGIRPPRFVYDFVIEGAGNVIDGYPFEGVGPERPTSGAEIAVEWGKNFNDSIYTS